MDILKFVLSEEGMGIATESSAQDDLMMESEIDASLFDMQDSATLALALVNIAMDSFSTIEARNKNISYGEAYKMVTGFEADASDAAEKDEEIKGEGEAKEQGILRKIWEAIKAAAIGLWNFVKKTLGFIVSSRAIFTKLVKSVEKAEIALKEATKLKEGHDKKTVKLKTAENNISDISDILYVLFTVYGDKSTRADGLKVQDKSLTEVASLLEEIVTTKMSVLAAIESFDKSANVNLEVFKEMGEAKKKELQEKIKTSKAEDKIKEYARGLTERELSVEQARTEVTELLKTVKSCAERFAKAEIQESITRTNKTMDEFKKQVNSKDYKKANVESAKIMMEATTTLSAIYAFTFKCVKVTLKTGVSTICGDVVNKAYEVAKHYSK